MTVLLSQPSKIILGGRHNLYCLVDQEDFDRLNKSKWFLDSKGYAYRNIIINGKRTTRRMHQEVLNYPLYDIDHINLNKLDNRKENLLASNKSKNAYNTKPRKTYGKRDRISKYKGVSYRRGSWRMTVRLPNGKTIDKCFKTELEAAKAYDLYAKDFARTNFN
jgi:hypothetical protein